MINVPTQKEHFNLYYIFKEDKEKRSLPEAEVNKLCEEIILKFQKKSFS